jgi:predicted O-methyltransferase YrrM
MNMLQTLALLLGVAGSSALPSVNFVNDRLSWLKTNLPPRLSLPKPIYADLIETRAVETQQLGAKPLWEGYATLRDYPQPTAGSARESNQVRSTASAGRFFAWLVAERRPSIIVEFGTAFGVSGMYWLGGLERNRHGRLLTFEPNAVWAEIAQKNLAAIGSRFELTVGTFEENIDAALGPDERVDIAFVDAIHTSAFVFRQFDILAPRMQRGGLVLFDDINFSDDMATCWQTLATDRRVRASATVDGRLGVVEIGESHGEYRDRLFAA